MDSIDKVLIRIGIIILGGLLGTNVIQNKNINNEIAQTLRHIKTTNNASFVPLPPSKP